MTRMLQLVSRMERAFPTQAMHKATEVLARAIPIKLLVNVCPFRSSGNITAKIRQINAAARI